MPSNRLAPDFRNIQGDSAIPWNTVTTTSCDRKVNRVADAEGEGSHPARRATQHRGCQPQRINQGPTGRYYRFSHVVPCYRRESVITGKDPGRGGDSRRIKSKRGGSKVPASCSSTMQADLMRAKWEREGSPSTKKYEQGGRRQGQDISHPDRTDRATQEGVQHQRAWPPGQLLHQQPETSNCVLTMEGGLPTVQIAKRDASGSAG